MPKPAAFPSPFRRRSLLAGIVLAVALPAPALAAESTWDLTFQASGSYRDHDVTDGSSNQTVTTDDAKADFEYRVDLPGLVFDGGRLKAPVAGPASGWGTASFSRETRSPTATTRVDCEGTDLSEPPTGGSIEADPTLGGGDAAEALVLQPFRAFTFGLPCTGAWDSTDLDLTAAHGNASALTHPFTVLFTLPPAALAQGKIIHRVESVPVRTRPVCEDSDVCELRWSGEIVLTRRGTAPAQGVVAPAPTVRPQPGPAVVAPPAAATPGRAALDRKGTRVALPVTCPAACSGTVRAHVAGGRASARPLASRSFTLGRAGSTRVTVKLTPAARRALRRHRRLELRITTSVAGGAAQSQRVVVRSRR